MRLDTPPLPANQSHCARPVSADELHAHRRRMAAPWQARHLARKHFVPLGAALVLAEAAGFGLEARQ